MPSDSILLPVVVFVLVLLVLPTVYLGWLWSVAGFLYSKLPPGVEMPWAQFKGFFLVPVLCIAASIVGMGLFMGNWLGSNADGLVLAMLIPIYFFATASLFYLSWFVAKCLVIVEQGSDIDGGEYYWELALIWVWPLGIWMVQPRVNHLYNQHNHATETR